MKPNVEESDEASTGFEAPDGVHTFFRGDVYVIDTESDRYTFIVSDPVATSGTLVGGALEDACAATLLGSVSRDSSDFAFRALQVGLLAVFSISTSDGVVGRRLYRISAVKSLRRVMRSGNAPP